MLKKDVWLEVLSANYPYLYKTTVIYNWTLTKLVFDLDGTKLLFFIRLRCLPTHNDALHAPVHLDSLTSGGVEEKICTKINRATVKNYLSVLLSCSFSRVFHFKKRKGNGK